jgi:DNA-binding MarR family transcriptional regulator
MKRQEILKELIDHFFAYESQKRQNDDYSITEFIGYLNATTRNGSIGIRKIAGEEENWIDKDYRSNTRDISILLVLMYRYAKGYIKKVMKNSRLQTADEFSFLITLMTWDSLTKSELVNKQVMGKTSGAEIIRRLAANGFISEFNDENDKRSVRVSITPEGRNEIISILPGMNDVSRIIAGNLTPGETNTLAYLLKKLDYFHNDIYMNMRSASIKEIGNLLL